MEVEPERHHADAAELAIDVRTFGQFVDVLAPAGQDLLTMAGIRSDAEHAADMIEDDGGARKRAGQVDRVR